ncbi:hypothetical protein [Anoxynatronum buryatiense]|uniref:DUF3311 domain-containing protein n=1 Tax=Anoxynatronum buryatiense TaxID=489973 RepID=A0AA45WTL1_9CLOT|nr:hypothetical protein [Anoxynatronum buryatiense]SMP43756.1 hypothetical protein SAMN06296020_10292 [Anoxynatronum buryatiense]
MADSKKGLSAKTIWTLLLIGFAIMEFPGIYFINRIEPMIFGMPFIYSFTIVMWAYMCTILLYAYKTNWGKGADFIEGEKDEQDGVKGGNNQ